MDGRLRLDDLDLQTLTTIVGTQLADRVTERLADEGLSGLSFGDGFIIQHLIDGEPTVTDLAMAQGVTTQAVSQRLRSLEALGYVERTKDETDRRVSRVRLTPRGREAVESARRVRRELDDELAGSIGRTAVDQARETLKTLADALGAAESVANRSLRPPR